MQLATYEQWIGIKAKSFGAPSLTEEGVVSFRCDGCGGVGTILDHGEITGQEFEADCEGCEGTGLVEFQAGAVSVDLLRKHMTRDFYFTEVKKDLEALAKFTRQSAVNVLSEHGITSFCDISTKKVIHTFMGTRFRIVDGPEVH